ncbi:MAG: type IV pilin-like G/H family protein [Hormoscilla sp. SP5CHS1]|nr:type IV pilin-like G/H family protein [Hormoscilla sp. SP12CHS1]MBC6454379.1 type IV pilin-like G/H family protein [Hormoscilla sp. SP5CHS1]
MKTEFKTKFLQHLIDKKQDKGFTLIELLVVIIIIGILSSIALPSFIGQANKAKQSEAKAYIGSMNRAQHGYYLEKAKFVTAISDVSKLGLGFETKTDNYTYGIAGSSNTTAVTNFGDGGEDKSLQSYLGGVVAIASDATALTILCESDSPNQANVETATATTGKNVTCPESYSKI